MECHPMTELEKHEQGIAQCRCHRVHPVTQLWPITDEDKCRHRGTVKAALARRDPSKNVDCE